MAIYNVFNFGAKGNGITDDRLAIQKAVDAASAAGGGTVYLPAGEYRVSGTGKAADGSIELKNNVVFQGAGMGLTTIKVADGYASDITGIVRTVSGKVNSNVTIMDMTIDGNKAHTTGEIDGLFTGVTPGSVLADNNIQVQRVEIQNVSRYGFDPHEQTHNLTIKDSIAHDNGKDGFVLDFIVGGTIENNISYNNGRHGFNVVTTTSDILFQNNSSYNNGANGLIIQRGSENIPSPYDITISGGKYYENGEAGILAKMMNDLHVDNASIYENGTQGIRLQGVTNALIENNIIRNNSQSDNGAYDEISIAEYNDKAGASGKIYASNNNTIANNTITIDPTLANNSRYAIREEQDSSDYTHIINNVITGSVVGDIYIAGSHSTVSSLSGSDVSGTNSSNTIIGNGYHNIMYGWGGNDVLIGNSGNDSLYGGKENDSLEGGSGNDALHGEDGNDRLLGGGGNDLLYGSNGADTLNGGGDNDLLSGGAHNDYLIGSSGDDKVYGDAGIDTLYGGGGNDTLQGSGDNDFLYGEKGNDTLYGGSGNDSLSGSSEQDVLFGDGEKDTIIGGSGMDTLYGGSDNDFLKGESENDILEGESGNDILEGGNGIDRFIFHSASGQDVITDFKVIEDIIQIDGDILSQVSQVLSMVKNIQDGAVIQLSGTNTVTLLGINASEITADNIDII